MSYSTVCRHESVYGKFKESPNSLSDEPGNGESTNGDICIDHIDLSQSQLIQVH